MPTISQLPVATAVHDSDLLLLDRSGNTAAVTAASLLQGTQPRLALSQGALLGRVDAGTGGPEPVALGPGLLLQTGSLQVDKAFVQAASSAALTFTGDVTGTGTSTISLSLNAITTPGTYAKVTVNAKGQVVQGSTLNASDVTTALGYTPLNPQAISFSGANLSSGLLTATGSTVARSLASRAAERPNVLDFGADPTGVADSAPAFTSAMASVSLNSAATLVVPRGLYRLGSPVNEPAGRLITAEFENGANLIGNGYLGVERVDLTSGAYRMTQVSGGFFGYPATLGNPANVPFDLQILQNTQQNSASARIGWSRDYANYNRYSKYSGGIDFGEQSIFSWPRLVDNTSGWAHWEVVKSAVYDEDTASRAQLAASGEHSEYDVVNNGPDYGWTYRAGVGTPIQGISLDPWGQNGSFGGHVLYAYGTVGSFDGVAGGLNQRWIAYPAVYSAGNPAPVPQASSLAISFDVTAKATAILSAAGSVASVTVTNGGGAYTSAPTVVFSGGGGTGAAATAVVVGMAVVAVQVTSAGHGYVSAPSISFLGGGAPAPVTQTVTLNSDGAHGDLASVASAVRTAGIPLVSASVVQWGGAVSRLVIFGTARGDVGTLTLGGNALTTLGIAAQSYVTQRDDTAIAFGAATGVAPGDRFVINGNTITVGGSGSPADIAAAVSAINQPGLQADVIAGGRLVLTAYLPQQPCGLVLAQPAGSTTLGKLALAPGTILPPTPPKAFATAAGEIAVGSCQLTDAIQVSATDLAGNVYGPIIVTLNGGAGTGSVADVVASVRAALQKAGFLSSGYASLTTAPAVVACYEHNGGASAGLVIRNTAGGTLTLANVAGTPLDTLGMVAGTYQPGGYSAGSQTVFHAAPDSISPQGRGAFLGGSSVPDPTAWPHAPVEVRGNFAHGLRTDKASFGDGNALLLGAGQAIGWGLGGPTLTAAGGQIAASAPASLPALTLTALPTSAVGLPAGSVWNNGGVLSIV